VPSNENPKEVAFLLRDVSGIFQPGEMTALVRAPALDVAARLRVLTCTCVVSASQMGPSGSGKTTLLDVLAGRKTAGKTTGTLLFGGAKPSRAFLRRYTGYVEQFDTLLPVLTVEEMLLYTAELKRPMSEPLDDKRAAVEELLDALALTPCRDVKIGDPLTKGISGGQAKRTNIGIALITNPRVLFLDGACFTRQHSRRAFMRHASGLLGAHSLLCCKAGAHCSPPMRRADERPGQLHGQRDDGGGEEPGHRRRDCVRHHPQPDCDGVWHVRRAHDAHARPHRLLRPARPGCRRLRALVLADQGRQGRQRGQPG
jgi:ABC-type uncharacterized transport system YnjBCD ATPase subunit